MLNNLEVALLVLTKLRREVRHRHEFDGLAWRKRSLLELIRLNSGLPVGILVDPRVVVIGHRLLYARVNSCQLLALPELVSSDGLRFGKNGKTRTDLRV